MGINDCGYGEERVKRNEKRDGDDNGYGEGGSGSTFFLKKRGFFNYALRVYGFLFSFPFSFFPLVSLASLSFFLWC